MMRIYRFLWIFVFLAAGCCRHSSPLALPHPGGPFPVGVTLVALKDGERLETLTENPADYREVVVQIWYPAAAADSCAAPYLDDITAEYAAQEYHLPQDFNRNIITHSGTDQPAHKSEKGFPVILFSHGLGMTREAYTCFCEHLASHGYVVAAVNHTYAAEITTFPDGRTYRFNLQEPVSPGLFASRRARAEYTRVSEAFHADLLRIWTQDLRFVLDKLTELNAPDSGHILSGSMNVAKAGVFGHSFGGAAAARTTQQDARFLAVADLDGSLWAESSTAPLPRPFLLINHANAYRWDGTRSSAMEHLQAGGVNLEIARTGHMDFSDAGLLMHHFMSGWIRIFLSKQEFGRIDPSRCLTVTNAYLLAFFDKYLKGIDASLLHGPSSEFPEVSLEVRACEPQE